jgi:hypothetical protein
MPPVTAMLYFLQVLNLKLLSSEMDQVFIKERGGNIFNKIRPPPILREPFKVLEHLLDIYMPIIQQFR